MHPSSEAAPYSLRYPIGEPGSSKQTRQQAIEAIAELPTRFRMALQGLSDRDLDASYRDGGWTLRQLTHHLADSHMHAYIRLRFALVEE